jgi:hypothetical protein
MLAVELDGNYIDAEPMKSRSAKELTDAYKRIYVISHGIGGIDIPAKMARLAKSLSQE